MVRGPVHPATTAKDELKHYCNYLSYRKNAVAAKLLPSQSSTATNSTTEHATKDNSSTSTDSQFFRDDFDKEDDEWVDLTKDALKVPEVDNNSSPRLATEGGPIQDLLSRFKTQAVKTSLLAAGMTGTQMLEFTRLLAESSGFLANSTTAEEFAGRFLVAMPALKGVKGVVGELKRSFEEGKRVAGERKGLRVEGEVVTSEWMVEMDGKEGEGWE